MAEFPLNVLHGTSKEVPAANVKVPSTDFKMWAAHGPEQEQRDLVAGAKYINSNMVYVIVFILMTLGLFYLVGKKATTYFLLLVLLGQLIIPGGTGAGISELTKSFKIFKG